MSEDDEKKAGETDEVTGSEPEKNEKPGDGEIQALTSQYRELPGLVICNSNFSESKRTAVYLTGRDKNMAAILRNLDNDDDV